MKEDKILKKGFNTLAIHGEGEERKPANALNSPVFMTSTFTFDNLDHAERTFSFDCDDYVYTRGNNPNLRELERKMALLEGGVDSVVFATGMAAISSVLFSLLKPGDKIIAHQVLYGSSYNVIKKLLPAYGIKSEFVDLTAVDKLEEYLGDESDEVRVIYFETPANPNLDLIDIKAIAELAGDKDIKIVVDNTFATPYLQRPLELGADVVVHSATKYLNGHGDVLGGVAVAKEEDYIQSLKFEYMTEFGGVLSPFNAWLILRGLKTLGIRMEKHQENARKVAEYLAEHDKVQKVFYPGLTGTEGQELARRQMKGPGAMLSFELKAGLEEARVFVDRLKMIKLAVSLGDTETLIEYPFFMTHRDYSKEDLRKLGMSSKLLRISAGLEDADDIIADLDQALAGI